MKNRSFHAGIQRSPYEAMFGCPPQVGLDAFPLPEVVLKTLRTEEGLKEAFKSTQRTSANPDDLTLDDSTVEPALRGESSTTARPCTSCGIDVTPLPGPKCALCLRKDNICHNRKESHDSLSLQAKRCCSIKISLHHKWEIYSAHPHP